MMTCWHGEGDEVYERNYSLIAPKYADNMVMEVYLEFEIKS